MKSDHIGQGQKITHDSRPEPMFSVIYDTTDWSIAPKLDLLIKMQKAIIVNEGNTPKGYGFLLLLAIP